MNRKFVDMLQNKTSNDKGIEQDVVQVQFFFFSLLSNKKRETEFSKTYVYVHTTLEKINK